MQQDRISFWQPVFASIALAGLVLWGGCDNTLDPFAEDNGLFSVYGYLTLSGNQHYIRVRNLNDPLVEDSTRVLDATVTLENLSTGTTETLTDSVIIFEGTHTHNYRTDQDIHAATTYRLTVERADGRTTTATATMPQQTKVEVVGPSTVSCTQDLQFFFQNVSHPRLLRISVGINWDDQWHWTRDQALGRDTLATYGFVPWRIVERTLPGPVLNTVEDPEDYCTLLDDNEIRITYTHFGPDWPADSVLANPVESSVNNGLGVFGGLHRDTLTQSVITE